MSRGRKETCEFISHSFILQRMDAVISPRLRREILGLPRGGRRSFPRCVSLEPHFAHNYYAGFLYSLAPRDYAGGRRVVNENSSVVFQQVYPIRTTPCVAQNEAQQNARFCENAAFPSACRRANGGETDAAHKRREAEYVHTVYLMTARIVSRHVHVCLKITFLNIETPKARRPWRTHTFQP